LLEYFSKQINEDELVTLFDENFGKIPKWKDLKVKNLFFKKRRREKPTKFNSLTFKS